MTPTEAEPVSISRCSREALLVEAVRWAIAESLERTLPNTLEDLDDRFGHVLLDFVRADPDLQIFQYEILVESRRNPQLRELATVLVSGYVDALERILRARGHAEPRLAAQVAHAALDGFVFQQLAQPDAESLERGVQFFVRILGADLPTPADTVAGSRSRAPVTRDRVSSTSPPRAGAGPAAE